MSQIGHLKLTCRHNILLAFLVGILTPVGMLVRPRGPSTASPHGCQYDDNWRQPAKWERPMGGAMFPVAM